MASDGRYVYHGPPDGSVPYPYPAYPPAPYDHAQFAQNVSRPPPRSASAQAPSSHPPPPQPYTSPPVGYPPPGPYGPPPPSYPVPPSAAGQPPNGESWHHYPHWYPPPHPPGQEPPPYSSTAPRPDAPVGEHRAYQPGPSRPAEPERPDERQSRQPEPAPQSKVRKSNDPNPPAPPPPRSPPLGLDFAKFLEQINVVMDVSNGLLQDSQSRSVLPADSIERMLQSATFGYHALDAAKTRASQAEPLPPPPPAPAPAPVVERPPEESPNAPSPPRSRPSAQGENALPAEGQTCLGCNATSTPEWRRGPMGPRTLCNACGLVYAKLIKKRNRDPARPRGSYPGQKQGGPGGHHMMDDSAPASDGGSDDEDSYGSHDRRSDGGYRGGGRD